jgi:hypothetical protein
VPILARYIRTAHNPYLKKLISPYIPHPWDPPELLPRNPLSSLRTHKLLKHKGWTSVEGCRGVWVMRGSTVSPTPEGNSNRPHGIASCHLISLEPIYISRSQYPEPTFSKRNSGMDGYMEASGAWKRMGNVAWGGVDQPCWCSADINCGRVATMIKKTVRCDIQAAALLRGRKRNSHSRIW